LFGRLAGDFLDLVGTFRILGSGPPKDRPNKGEKAPRSGTLGEVPIDGEKMLMHLGGLTPSDYSLLYLIGSETAHLLDRENDLVALFSRYATGGINSPVNPQAAMMRLADDITKVKKNLEAKISRRTEVQNQLSEALARPARIREIESQIRQLEDDSDRIRKEISAGAERLGDLQAAIGVFDRENAARSAENALADVAHLPADVAVIATDLEVVAELAEKLDRARTEVASSEYEVRAACRAVGVDAETLAAHTLTNVDLQEFIAAELAISDKQKALDDAKVARRQHEDEVRSASGYADTCITQGKLDAEVFRRRVLDVDKITALGIPAYAVEQAARNVHQCERALAAARAAVNAGPEKAHVTAEDKLRPVLPAVLGVVGAVLGGFWGGAASIAAGIFGAALGVVVARVFRDKLALPHAPTSTSIEVAQADLERARLDLADNLAKLNTSLVGLGLPPATEQDAVAHVGDVERALRALGEVGRVKSLTVGLDAAVEKSESGLLEAKVIYGELFERRGLPRGPEGGVAAWLQVYADAVERAVKHNGLVQRCAELESNLISLTSSVESLNDVSFPSVIGERARNYIVVRDELQQLARDAKTRRDEVDIATGERPQVRELLRAGNKEKLEADKRWVESEIDGLENQRSDVDQKLGALRTELLQRNEHELVANLTEERGRFDDDIEAFVKDYVTLAVALESIEKVAREYELRNQGPVIEAAQELITSVDSSFGTLYIDRTAGEARLMVDRSGRRVSVQRLSTGARALVYLALRLAFQIVDSQKRPIALPLICDDPLVTVDDRRVVPLMRLLQKVSEERQVIYVTCHERETSIARAIGARVVEMN